MTVRPGARLGIDVGRARIGVARCDPSVILAVPVETVPRSAEGEDGDVRRILEIAAEYDAIELVVGNPLSLSGQAIASSVDERMSTVSAQQALRSAGKSSRKQRPIIDQAAAVIILQHAIDAERASGTAPGRTFLPDEGL